MVCFKNWCERSGVKECGNVHGGYWYGPCMFIYNTNYMDIFCVNQRRIVAKPQNWAEQNPPYETLELEGDADDEQIKIAFRCLAKFYHPDVYDGRGTLGEGEIAKARFIKIQAAYELLIDGERRRQYDMDNRVNPMKASQAWMDLHKPYL
ncbi:NAD(P)H-quinone oxidoreductase subunit T, chloroplastic-like [Abrus precatorius]|uniref:NAD(P)H-quinone oxidoreductase subunit T, chloroplastic-like n=1 Tax=Abrus precatorius TaxID=3816 RepID=A0A8B8L529_ABRPR|nr:NAD(P)H-quinone oxidoreductase subunit T, chloroplastic-like [Abrus precatorius]